MFFCVMKARNGWMILLYYKLNECANRIQDYPALHGYLSTCCSLYTCLFFSNVQVVISIADC